AAVAALARVLARAAVELHAEFARAQRVDHPYVAGAARQSLSEDGAPTDLALRTGLALRHILVDEFQDTSLAQLQLLEALTIGWEEGDGRTLFVVGDPMQSIYRFRDAEVELFLRARTAGIGTVRLKTLRLTRNFRSTDALVDFVNEVFARVLPERDELRSGAVSYRESIGARADAPGAPVAIPALSLKLFPADPAAEARAIAAHVARLRRTDPDGSVAVLVAAHLHAVPVIDALEAHGVATLGVDLVPLAERMIVRDLAQLTRALHDLADRAAWLAVLRAPWCGARLTTLTALSELNDPELIIEALANPRRLAECDPAERARLARVRGVLEAALGRRGTAPVAEWLEATWLRLGASDAYPAADLPDARAFFAALAGRTSAFEWAGAEDLGALLEGLYSASGRAGKPVEVMTIHRAKGLEFDHVIVPALERPRREGERRLLRWIDLPSATRGSDSELLIAPAPAVGGTEENQLDAYIKDLLRERDSNERRRLLYVAATRARRSLWLSACPALAADGGPRFAPRCPLALLWPALG
ncbi:MAG: UvrD-helicase domain-containing protein, partial [Steroidobacteraceae bacterium]